MYHVNVSCLEPTRGKQAGAQHPLKRWREPPIMSRVESPSDQWQKREILTGQH